MTETTSGTQPPITTLDILASSTLLFALAVALPLLDLLGRNAAFFVVRDSSASDIVGLALVVTIVLPLLLAGLAILAGRIHGTAGVWIHGAIFVFLGAVLALSIIRQTPLADLTGWIQIGIALAAAALLYMAYRRSPTLRLGVRWTWIAPLAVLGLFLFGSSASRLIVGSASAATESVAVGNPAPVVFLVFDALSVSDLMDGDGALQEDVYPNFARLARDGTWYRNAITMHYNTSRSLPAILNGLETRRDQVPTLSDHPNNLFTLLDDSYETFAFESITKLCPSDECDQSLQAQMTPFERWQGLANDLKFIAGHLFLPADLAEGLPPIDDTWDRFGRAAENNTTEVSADDSDAWEGIGPALGAALDQDRRQTINRFIESIADSGDQPTLHFLHALVPHSPWNYLADGRLNDLPEGRFVSRVLPEGWVDDPWRMEQVRQLHLIQVQYVDTVVGEVLDRLDTLGTYDDSLIVVVADHGETFRPGMPRQRGEEVVIHDVLAVPLFIKAPHHSGGEIDDYRAYTIDIVPTVADLLGINLPWEVDGMSLVATERPARPKSEVMTHTGGTVEFPPDGSLARALAQERIERFGSAGPFGLAPEGFADLLGKDVDTIEFADPFAREVRLQDPERFNDVDMSADVLPVSLRGHIVDGDGSDFVVAIAINGKVAAVTRSYLDGREDTQFDALLPPEALHDGFNALDLFVVSGSDPAQTFHPISWS